jgi:TolB protein
MAADGTDRVNLTAALARDGRPSQDEQPSWSPDGRRLAFRSNRDGPLEIYAIGTDGSGLVKLTYWTGGDGQPDWGFPPRR